MQLAAVSRRHPAALPQQLTVLIFDPFALHVILLLECDSGFSMLDSRDDSGLRIDGGTHMCKVCVLKHFWCAVQQGYKAGSLPPAQGVLRLWL